MLRGMRTGIRRRSYRVIALAFLLLAVLGVALYTGFAVDIGLAIISRIPTPTLGLGAAPHYDGPVSLEERILEADVIVRAKMI